MNFQNLKNVEDSQHYIDVALNKGGDKARSLRNSIKIKKSDKIIKSKKIETARLEVISDVLKEKLNIIYTNFPSLDNLPEFYNQLMKLFLNTDKIKKALGSVMWAEKKIQKLSESSIRKIRRERNLKRITKITSSAIGRICSIVKQINKHLKIIENARRVMKGFPAIKTSVFTIAISGFPNVGKSTLLSEVTPSRPEIKNYAFTTKRLNTGYYKTATKKFQFIDTPGTLARFEKMNPIEKQAFLAMRYCADIIIYIFDLSDATYSLPDQENLFERIQNLDKPIIIYLSKTDIINKDKIEKFISNHKEKYTIIKDKEKLIPEITKLKKDVYLV